MLSTKKKKTLEKAEKHEDYGDISTQNYYINISLRQ